MTSIAADVAEAKSTHYGVCSEPSIKGRLLCEFICQGICYMSCRCCLWGSFGELSRFVCKPKAEGCWVLLGVHIAGRGLVGSLILQYYYLLSVWYNELVFTFVLCTLIY
jgi:hypothetical protein